jgi:DNA processing protein
LARGIDTAAHKAALKGGGRTLAVLGGALDKLYPAENRKLAEAIADQGAVLTEYPFGRAPDRTTFPYRNRIVSGLSRGIVVVEAGAQSGAVITANQALDQGRSVYAVPGRVDNPSARGCHALIRAGAMLVETLDDILSDLSLLLPQAVQQDAKAMAPLPEPTLSETEQRVVKALWDGAKAPDELAREAGVASAALSAMLLGLEMKRVVRILPGGRIALRDELYNQPDPASGATTR